MRILCNGFRWFSAADALADAHHDVVRVTSDQIAEAWAQPRADWWRDVVPPGWEPEVALFGWVEYKPAPPMLAELPFPVVLWIGDWYANAQAALQLADQVELVLADATGIAWMRRRGIANVEEMCPWTYDPAIHKPDWDAQPEWDVSFTGNINDSMHLERNRMLWKVAQMDPQLRIRLGISAYGVDYAHVAQRTRVTFNYSLTGDVNMRCFEAAACGSLLTINREAEEQSSRWFLPGKEIVVYDRDNVHEVIQTYLDDEPARLAIARAGQARSEQHSPQRRMPILLDILSEVARSGRRYDLPRRRVLDGAHAAAYLLTMPDAPASDRGVEVMLSVASLEQPQNAGLELSRAVLYARRWLDGVEQSQEPIAAALGHLQRAVELDREDGTALLTLARLAHELGSPRTMVLLDAFLTGVQAGSMVVHPDRQVLARGLTGGWIDQQRAILESDDPVGSVTRLALISALELASYVVAEDPRRQIQFLVQAVAIPERRPAVVYALAAALLRAGLRKEALDALQTVHAELPLFTDAWPHIVQLLVSLGREAEARQFAATCRGVAGRLPINPEDVAALGLRLPAAS